MLKARFLCSTGGHYMNLLPAILVGGPPHAGKSTLAYHLSLLLRAQGIAHYLLRAAPDGEGDWAYEMPLNLAQDIRFKGDWTQRWVDVTCRDVARRTLPLLVDVGGKPTPEQEIIFDQCTHAILLTKDPSQHAQWLGLAHKHNLDVIADLHSDLHGSDALLSDVPGESLRGVLAGLDRAQPVTGVAFQALAARLVHLLGFSREQLYRKHLAMAPFDAGQVQLVNLDEWMTRLHAGEKKPRFTEADLVPILASIAPSEPVALYGRAPTWLPVHIALQRQLSWQFDVRLGWVQPLTLAVCAPGETGWQANRTVAFTLTPNGPETILSIRLLESYLDYDEAAQLRLPSIANTQSVVLDGKIPLWLTTSLALAYRSCAGVIARQAQQINEEHKG
jgi:CRISPR-associated protein Csx3